MCQKRDTPRSGLWQPIKRRLGASLPAFSTQQSGAQSAYAATLSRGQMHGCNQGAHVHACCHHPQVPDITCSRRLQRCTLCAWMKCGTHVHTQPRHTVFSFYSQPCPCSKWPWSTHTRAGKAISISDGLVGTQRDRERQLRPSSRLVEDQDLSSAQCLALQLPLPRDQVAFSSTHGHSHLR